MVCLLLFDRTPGYQSLDAQPSETRALEIIAHQMREIRKLELAVADAKEKEKALQRLSQELQVIKEERTQAEQAEERRQKEEERRRQSEEAAKRRWQEEAGVGRDCYCAVLLQIIVAVMAFYNMQIRLHMYSGGRVLLIVYRRLQQTWYAPVSRALGNQETAGRICHPYIFLGLSYIDCIHFSDPHHWKLL